MASLFKTIYDERIFPIHSIKTIEELQNCIVLGFECCLLLMEYRSYKPMTFTGMRQHHNGLKVLDKHNVSHYVFDLGIEDPSFNTDLGIKDTPHLFSSREEAKEFTKWLDYAVLHQRNDPPW